MIMMMMMMIIIITIIIIVAFSFCNYVHSCKLVKREHNSILSQKPRH